MLITDEEEAETSNSMSEEEEIKNPMSFDQQMVSMRRQNN